MKPKRNKLVSLFLVFFLLTLSGNLYAKKQGAKLIITKKDGQQTEGELITVKPNSLLLLNTEGRDMSVGIADIKVIRIAKKSKWLLGGVLGAGICIVGCGVAGAILTGDEPPACDSALEFGLMMGACFSPIAALVGGIIGAVKGTDKTIYFVGMSDSEIREVLNKLRKRARIRDYK